MGDPPRVIGELADQLNTLGWVSHLLVAGSLATGDHVPGASDLDLVAIVNGPIDPMRQAALNAIHQRLDNSSGAGVDLGCVYVDHERRLDRAARHPTWTHGAMARRGRILSGITRAELVRHGFAVTGRAPLELFPAMSDDDVRDAAQAELAGYWAWAARRPWMWIDPPIADLGLTDVHGSRPARPRDR